MESKLEYISVGLFVLSIVVGAIFFAMWHKNYSQDRAYNYYRIDTTESVTGVNKRATVKLMGVVVGEVEELFINPKNSEEVSIIIKVDANTPIKIDSYATLKAQGITGLSYVEIEGGKNSSKILETDKNLDKMAIIPYKSSLLSRVDTSLSSIVERLEKLLDATTNMINNTNKIFSEKNVQNIENILDNSQITSKNLATISELIILENKKISKLIVELTNLSKNISKVTNEDVVNTLNSIKESANSTKEFMKTLEAKSDLAGFEIKNMLSNSLITFEDSMFRLNTILKNLEESPSDILYKRTKQNLGPGEVE